MVFALPFFFLYLIIRATIAKKDEPFLSLCYAAVAWILLLYCEVEFLSLFHALSFWPVLLFWLLSNLVLCAIFLCVLRKYADKKPAFKNVLLPIKFADLRNPFGLLLLCLSVFVLLISLRIVPYNWDSMTYHLTRIMFWAQNKSVAHYATSDARQISSPVISEFVNLNLYLLTKSDRLFNMIQSVSYLFNMVGVYAIAQKIGLSDNWKKFSVVMYVSAPIILAEAFSTQVDNMANVWMVIFAYICLLLFEKEKIRLDKKTAIHLIVLGSCLGLGYLTKPSVCVAMVVFSVAMMVVRFKKHDSFTVIFGSAFIAGITSLIWIAPEVARNIITYHALSDPVVGGQQLVGTYNPFMLAVNFIKNICYSLSIPFPSLFNEGLYSAVILFAKILGVDINHPAISEHGGAYRLGNVQSYDHDTAINPILMWLFLLTLVVCIVSMIKRKKVVNTFSICSLFSFLLFLVILRWEIFETRYQISYLTLLCPTISFVFSQVINKKTVKIAFVSIVSFLCALSFASVFTPNLYHAFAAGSKRPVGYFSVYENAYEPYQNLTSEINKQGYKKIGLNISNGEYKYPLWPMCNSIEQVEYVVFDHGSAVYEKKDFLPDCIVWIKDLPESNEFVYHGRKYDHVFGSDGYYLLTCSEMNQGENTNG